MRKQSPKSSSSAKVPALADRDPVFQLGEKIAAELDANEGDTLGRWMAHYVAEMIKDAEKTKGPKAASARKKCAAAILEVWGHRSDWPRAVQPFPHLEAVARALAALDPEAEHPIFRAGLWGDIDAQVETPTVKKLLETAKGVEIAARELIDDLLMMAASAALNANAPWVALAQKAQFRGFEIDFIDKLGESAAGRRRRLRERERLAARIERLKNFVSSAEDTAELLRQQIADLDAKDAADSQE